MMVMFLHQVLPLSLTAFLFQGRAIANIPFLLSLLSLMLICQHFFLWSLIVCPASVFLSLFWQLLQTHLLLWPSLILVCVSYLLLPLMLGMTLLRSLLEGTCLSIGPEGIEEENQGEESSGTNDYTNVLCPNSFASRSYPFSTVWDNMQLLMSSAYTLPTLCICTVKSD